MIADLAQMGPESWIALLCIVALLAFMAGVMIGLEMGRY